MLSGSERDAARFTRELMEAETEPEASDVQRWTEPEPIPSALPPRPWT